MTNEAQRSEASDSTDLLGDSGGIRSPWNACMHKGHCCQMQDELDRLRAFAQDIMRAWPEGDVDGGELEEAALRHGLLEPAEPTQEERDEWGWTEGDLWYRKTALLSPNYK